MWPLLGESNSLEVLSIYLSHERNWRAAVVNNFQKEIAQLNRLQNNLAPVNRLAPELFVEIFKHLVEATIFESGHPPGPTRVGSLVLATRVCQYWREVALGAATLWTTFPLHVFPLAETFIARSRDLPLDIDLVLPVREPRLYKICKMQLLPQIPRLRTLILRVRDYNDLRDILRRLTKVSAPKLEGLLIRHLKHNPREGSPPMVDPSQPLFAGELPSLKRLSTVGVGIPLSLPASRGLAHLSLHNNVCLADKALIDLLAQCPGLESLRVKEDEWFSVRFRGAYLDARRPAVSLPRLKRLELDIHTLARIEALLHHISIPGSARLQIETAYDDFETEVEYSMFPKNALENLKCLSGIKRVEMFAVRERSTRPDSSLVLRAYHDAAAYDAPDVEIKVRMVQDLAELFIGTPLPFDVSQVETLVVGGIKGEAGYQKDDWVVMLVPMSHVKTVRAVSLGRTIVSDLARLLGVLTDGPGKQQFALCPDLDTLELVDLCGVNCMLDKSLKETVVARATWGALKELELFNVGCYGQDSPLVGEIKAECGLFVNLRVDEVD